MRRQLRRFRRDDAGTSTVEFALVSSVLMLVIMGLIHFGVLAFRRNNATEAARFGARFVMVRGSESGRSVTQAQLQDTLRARLAIPNLTVTLTYPDGGTPSNAPGKRVRVALQYPSQSVLGGRFSAVTIRGQAESVIVY